MSSASIDLLTSCLLCNVRTEAGTVEITTDTQLVANSNFAPDKKSPFSAFKIASRASIIHRLRAKLEWTGFIFPIKEGEIVSLLTITSRIPAGDSLRHS